MNYKLTLLSVLVFISFINLRSQSITRMLFFNLKYEAGTPDADAFLEGVSRLEEIPSLVELKLQKVQSNKMEYAYAISLVFKDEEGVKEYVAHPIHKTYLEEEWKPNVEGAILVDLLDFPSPEVNE